jgi:hypothetical protein
VDCRDDPNLGDIPTVAVPIENPTRFKSWLEQATSGLTVPPHDGVRHHMVPEGFVISLIPAGLHPPYQTVGDLSYFIRAGTNFARAPHAVLAGMFGRKPQPLIKEHYIVPQTPTIEPDGGAKTAIGIVLKNFGLGIAENVFLNLKITSHPGDFCELRFEPSTEQNVWWGRLALSQEMHLIARTGFPLPPEAFILPLTLNITLRNPIERNFAFQGICGAAGCESWRFEFKNDHLDVVNAFDAISRTAPDAPDFKSLARRFNKHFYRGIPGV